MLELAKSHCKSQFNEANPEDYNRWLFEGLNVNPEKGLDNKDFKEREREYGHNRREDVKAASFMELLCEALEDTTLRILLGCSILSIGISLGTEWNTDMRNIAWVEGFAIFMAVVVSSTVTAGNDY